MHVAKLMSSFLQMLFANAQKYWKTKRKQGGKTSEGKQVWNQLTTGTAGNLKFASPYIIIQFK
jgi:hypothetical protein